MGVFIVVRSYTLAHRLYITIMDMYNKTDTVELRLQIGFQGLASSYTSISSCL